MAVIEGTVKLSDDADANGPGLFFDFAIPITRGVDMHCNGQICSLCGSDHKALEDK